MFDSIFIFPQKHSAELPRHITKKCLYNFDPFDPHFYIVKLGFTGLCTIFLISAQKQNCKYLLELPHWGSSNEYPQSMFWAEIRKILEFFIWKFSFFGAEFSVYLDRHVFVMKMLLIDTLHVCFNGEIGKIFIKLLILHRAVYNCNRWHLIFFFFFFFFFNKAWQFMWVVHPSIINKKINK